MSNKNHTGDRKLTPRQKKLIPLLLEYEEGKLTLEEALKQAGYADSTAKQQSTVLSPLRNNSVMQAALDAAGFTEELIATKIVEGLKAKRPLVIEKEIVYVEDPDAQHKYLKTGAELKDAFPAKKQLNAEVTLDDLIKTQEG